MNSSRSTRPLSPPTSFIRAPLSAKLKMRVLAVSTRCSRTTSPTSASARYSVSPLISITLPKRPMAVKVGPERSKRRDLAVLDQHVVEGDRQLAVDRRPVVGVVGLDDDPGVEAHLLGEVLADVRVVPVEARVGEREAVGELAAVRDRRLRLVGHAVEAVFEAQAVPVQRRVDVTEVGRLDRHLAVLVDVQGRAGDRAVVAEHPHLGVAEALADRLDRDLVRLAVAEPDDLGARRLLQALGLGAEVRPRLRCRISSFHGQEAVAASDLIAAARLACSPRSAQQDRRRRCRPIRAGPRSSCTARSSRAGRGPATRLRLGRGAPRPRSSLISGISIQE